jgi:leader peptidase (prepilin peptidase)/N-methyltransferase
MIVFLFGVIGILVGILLNRAADNLPPPARRSPLEPPRCPYCDAPRTAVEQSGILSFVLRRDRCHACAAPLRLRAPLVELASAVLFGFLAARYTFGLYLVAVALFTALLLLIVVIDIEHKLILNVVVLPAAFLALLLSPITLAGPDVAVATLNVRLIALSLLGAAIGYAVTYGIYAMGILFLRLVNRNRTAKINTVAFGMGDVKLAGFLGALVGFPAIFNVLIYTVLLGGLGALLAILWQVIRRRSYSGFMSIPYGPYFCIAGWVTLIWR